MNLVYHLYNSDSFENDIKILSNSEIDKES